MPHGSGSTTAGGHSGTGVGVHASTWVHYNPPTGSSNGRHVFTEWSYHTANTAIAASTHTNGYVNIACKKWTPTVIWRCSNLRIGNLGRCPVTGAGSSAPAPSGCNNSSGRHTFTSKHDWTSTASTRKLYFDKGGSTILVSFHAI